MIKKKQSIQIDCNSHTLFANRYKMKDIRIKIDTTVTPKVSLQECLLTRTQQGPSH